MIRRPFRAERVTAWSTIVAVFALAALFSIYGLLFADAARATVPPTIGDPYSATRDAVLPNTGWPLTAWGVVFAVLVAFGAALALPHRANKRTGRA